MIAADIILWWRNWHMIHREPIHERTEFALELLGRYKSKFRQNTRRAEAEYDTEDAKIRCRGRTLP